MGVYHLIEVNYFIQSQLAKSFKGKKNSLYNIFYYLLLNS